MLRRARGSLSSGQLAFLAVMVALAFFGVLLQEEAAPANAAPAEQQAAVRRIVVDAGHGGVDGGSTGVHGESEKELNLKIAAYLKGYLDTSGLEVVMTRETDTSLHTSENASIAQQKAEDIRRRLALMDEQEGTITISIHQNHFGDAQYSGAQMFYGTRNPQSEVLAQTLQAAIVQRLQPENQRSIKRGTTDVYLLTHVESPIVLVECGFLSNAEEAARLADDAYQREMAFAIYCGVMEYCDAVGSGMT